MNSVASITHVPVLFLPLYASWSLFTEGRKEGRTKLTCRPACSYLAAGKNDDDDEHHTLTHFKAASRVEPKVQRFPSFPWLLLVIFIVVASKAGYF